MSTSTPATGRVVIFLSHDDVTALRLAASCALTAVSLGDRVDLFAFGPAVRALVNGNGGNVAKPEAGAPVGPDVEPDAESDADQPEVLIARSRAQGPGQAGLRLFACSASVVEEKVDLADAERAFDAVVGWPTILAWSRGVVDRFFF